MAHVRVLRHEAEQGLLPPICVLCGATATGTIPSQFGWRPISRVLACIAIVIATMVLAGNLAVMANTRFGAMTSGAALLGVCLIGCLACVLLWHGRQAMSLCLPACKQHRGYWHRRQRLQNGITIPFLLFLMLSVLFENRESPILAELIGLGRIASGILWLIGSVALHYFSIRPVRIDEQSIILKNVSEGFAKVIGEAHLDTSPPRIRSEGIQAGIHPVAGDTGIQPESTAPAESHIQPGSP